MGLGWGGEWLESESKLSSFTTTDSHKLSTSDLFFILPCGNSSESKLNSFTTTDLHKLSTCVQRETQQSRTGSLQMEVGSSDANRGSYSCRSSKGSYRMHIQRLLIT
ncbi:unnamed protein product [Timema podura]|uniref:Uncharacterized protein n=1 Tax=Timema podura TaxID=61482 RepID=A0ABN7NNL4_TIMPD|nr:unnamed protein product [Timema podura]